MATQQQLVDAQTAYHKLVTGTAPRVVVDIDGSRVEFAPTNKADLYNYIQQLQQALGVATAPALCNYGPASFIF